MENETLTKIYNMFIYILDYWFGSVWFGLNPNQTKPFGLSKT